MTKLTPSGVLAFCDAARSQAFQMKAAVPAAHILNWVYLEGREDSNRDWPRSIPAEWVQVAREAVADFEEHRPVDKRCLVALPRLHQVVRNIEAENPKLQDWTRAWPGPPPSKVIRSLTGAMAELVRNSPSLRGVAVQWPGQGPAQMGDRGLLEVRFGSHLEFEETASAVSIIDAGTMGFRAQTSEACGPAASDTLVEAIVSTFAPHQNLTVEGVSFRVTIDVRDYWTRHGIVHQVIVAQWSLLQAG